MKALISPAVRQRIDTLLATTKGVRASVILTRFAFVLGFIAGGSSLGVLLVTLSGFVPGKAGVITAGVGGGIAAVCTCAAALGPKMTEAAGLLHEAEDGQTPFFDVLPEIFQVLGSAKQITRDAEAQALADAKAAEQKRAQEAETASHAALVTTLVAELAPLLERSSSYKFTPEGLVEDGVLAPAPADKVSTPLTKTEAVIETVASDAQKVAPDAQQSQAQGQIVLDAKVVSGEAAAAS